MIETNKMSDRELNAAIAELCGFKAFKERRGNYNLCVMQRPGDREPWLQVRRPEPERYEQVSAAEAALTGFYGEGFPPFATDLNEAFRAADVMVELGWDFGTGTMDGIFASFGKGKTEILVRATSHARAICEAVLMAANDKAAPAERTAAGGAGAAGK